jgi:hypothetical protein
MAFQSIAPNPRIQKVVLACIVIAAVLLYFRRSGITSKSLTAFKSNPDAWHDLGHEQAAIQTKATTPPPKVERKESQKTPSPPDEWARMRAERYRLAIQSGFEQNRQLRILPRVAYR